MNVPKYPAGSLVTLNDPTYDHGVFEVVKAERLSWNGFIEWNYTLRNVEHRTIEQGFEEDLRGI